MTLWDLGDYSVSQLTVTLNRNRAGQFEEVHPYLAGSPLTLYLTAGEEIRRTPSTTSSRRDRRGCWPGPSRSGRTRTGRVIAPDGSRLYVTVAEGLTEFEVAGGWP
ncbi:MAG: hypothetical protein U0531_19475 [Dehalococcoidia bacterium]